MIELVAKYQAQADDIERPGSTFTEADTRLQYIDKLLALFGWDVYNDQGASSARLEVVLERSGHDTVTVYGRPDYRLLVDGVDRLPVEAKKPSVSISDEASNWARQTHAYGLSLLLPAAVLTNMAELIIFDTTEGVSDWGGHVPVRPGCHWTVDQYVDRFDEMWEKLSWEVIASDRFHRVFDYTEPPRGQAAFDVQFLADFRRWRLALANDIAKDSTLDMREVGRRTQRILNALLFLRVHEDRHGSRYEHLKRQAENKALAIEFTQADRTFNADIFSTLGQYNVSTNVLADIVLDMYFPRTKYAFSLLEANTLAAVYEQYLAQDLSRDSIGTVALVEKPEHTHANGIVTTPQFVVDALLDEVLHDLDARAGTLRLLDPACGSGVFLLTALKRLIAHEEAVTQASVPLTRRAELVLHHLFGVDIDNEAVEVARLGLLLTILGDEQVTGQSQKLLPNLSNNIKLGNSIVGLDFDEMLPQIASDMQRRAAVSPFDWATSFPSVMGEGGFSAIVGNPPYIRIQELKKHFPDQVDYFQHSKSTYLSSKGGSFDAYMLFVERAITLLARGGTLSFIVQNRFTNTAAAKRLRGLLASRIRKLVHFGTLQLFPKRSTYTALLVLGDVTERTVQLDQVSDLEQWQTSKLATTAFLPRDSLGSDAWPLVDQRRAEIFEQMTNVGVAPLAGRHGWCHIYVGVQTSADALYLVQVLPESTDDLIDFEDPNGRRWSIERSITVEALLDVSMRAYDSEPVPDRVAIFPYYMTTSNTGHPQAKPYCRETMQDKYPLTLAYFEAWRDVLTSRSFNDKSDEWWRYGRPQNLTRVKIPKLIVRTMTLTPQQAYDRKGILGTGGGNGGPYTMMTPLPHCKYSFEVLQAILTHPAVDAFIASRGSLFRGGYVPHRLPNMKDVPLPPLTNQQQTSLTEWVIELHNIVLRQREDETRPVKERQSDRDRHLHLTEKVQKTITDAYGLTDAQVAALT